MGRHGVTRRSFLRTTTLGSAALALTPQIKSQPARLSRKPNLLIFLPDQQRPDTLACYGARHAFAPNLDKLASQSFVFEEAYITQPICTASRSSLFTGTWPHTNGCTHNDIRLDNRFRCWPELIADSDYRAGYMGKWHLGDEQFAQHGFHEWISIMDGWRAAFTSDRDPNAITASFFTKTD
jgi:arylsulfatase A-like enzyme